MGSNPIIGTPDDAVFYVEDSSRTITPETTLDVLTICQATSHCLSLSEESVNGTQISGELEKRAFEEEKARRKAIFEGP